MPGRAVFDFLVLPCGYWGTPGESQLTGKKALFGDVGNLMATKQPLKGRPEDADLRRADSLAWEIFSDVANKWALLIIEALGERTLRFSALRDEVEGISHKMLTQNLRMLERDGLVDRTVHPTVPPRVEYTGMRAAASTSDGREVLRS